MSRIHPTALVNGGAILADSAEVGPWCVVGPGVSLAEDVRLISHVAVSYTHLTLPTNREV